jgi:hypothetical protein
VANKVNHLTPSLSAAKTWKLALTLQSSLRAVHPMAVQQLFSLNFDTTYTI